MNTTNNIFNTEQQNQNQHHQHQHQLIQPYIKLLTQQRQSKPNLLYIHSIILKVTSNPTINVQYDEISALPMIQQTLQGSIITAQSLFNTLDLFSSG